VESLRKYQNEFLAPENPSEHMLINAVGQIIEKVISKIAAGSYFEFWPLAKLAHTFARVIPTNLLRNPQR